MSACVCLHVNVVGVSSSFVLVFIVFLCLCIYMSTCTVYDFSEKRNLVMACELQNLHLSKQTGEVTYEDRVYYAVLLEAFKYALLELVTNSFILIAKIKP